MKKTCSSCRFHSALQKQCKFNAPSAHILMRSNGDASVLGTWPAVQSNDWCGRWEGGENEHEPRNTKDTQ